MAKSIFKNTYYVQLYELSRSGLNLSQMAEAIGVSKPTLKAWRQNDPAVKDAIAKGRSHSPAATEDTGETFFEFVYKRLPEHLQMLWAEMEAAEEEGNDQKRLEALLAGQGKRSRQHLFCHALVLSNFNVSEACRRLNMSRETYKGWARTDPDFMELLDSIREMQKDFIEGSLMNLIKSGDVTATLFASRTINRDRGYDPKITVEHTGGVVHGLINLNELELPVDLLRQVLEAVQKRKELPEAGPRMIGAQVENINEDQ